MYIQKMINEFDKNISDYRIYEKKIEQCRKKFINDFSIQKIRSLSKNEYCIGGKKLNDPSYISTFCYRIEHGLRDLGSFRGSYSTKFGIFKIGVDEYDIYETWDNTNKDKYKKAFSMIKSEIISLLESGKRNDIKEIKTNKLFSNYKLKILSVYYPKKYLPIFSLKDMNLFLTKYNEPVKRDAIEANFRLLQLKNSNSTTKEWTNFEYMRFLFATYKPKKNKKIKVRKLEVNDRQLNQNMRKGKKAKLKYPKAMSKIQIVIKKGNKTKYKTKPSYKRLAIQMANYRCEICSKHTSFIRKKDNTPYMEAHHLVPMEYQSISKFNDKEISLDTPENIVSLCSNCHNKLHYGKEVKPILEKLYKKRKKYLLSKAIDVSLDELYNMYDV